MKNNLKKNVIWNTLGLTFNSFNSLFFLIIINRINGIDDGGIFSFYNELFYRKEYSYNYVNFVQMFRGF